jgi:spore maturation protein CgeB
MKKYRIFLALGGQASTIKGSKMWIRNLFDPLIELNHEVYLLDIDDYVLQRSCIPMSLRAKEVLSNDLVKVFLKEHEKTKFDLFLGYLHNGQIEPDVLKDIKKNVFTVNYTTNPHQFAMYEDIARVVDLNIVSHQPAVSLFKAIDAKYYYMPFAANPDFYKPAKGYKTPGAAFIGSTYGIRPYYLWRVLQNNIDLKVYGSGWKFDPKKRYRRVLRKFYSHWQNLIAGTDESLRFHDNSMRLEIINKLNENYPENLFTALDDDQYQKVLSESEIIININESRRNQDFLDPDLITGCNLRDFETTMSGSFLLTQYSETIKDFFVEGDEMVSFINEIDLVEKIKYYLGHEREREKIASNGYSRSHADHTWQKRYNKFLNEITI